MLESSWIIFWCSKARISEEGIYGMTIVVRQMYGRCTAETSLLVECLCNLCAICGGGGTILARSGSHSSAHKARVGSAPGSRLGSVRNSRVRHIAWPHGAPCNNFSADSGRERSFKRRRPTLRLLQHCLGQLFGTFVVEYYVPSLLKTQVVDFSCCLQVPFRSICMPTLQRKQPRWELTSWIFLGTGFWQ